MGDVGNLHTESTHRESPADLEAPILHGQLLYAIPSYGGRQPRADTCQAMHRYHPRHFSGCNRLSNTCPPTITSRMRFTCVALSSVGVHGDRCRVSARRRALWRLNFKRRFHEQLYVPLLYCTETREIQTLPSCCTDSHSRNSRSEPLLLCSLLLLETATCRGVRSSAHFWSAGGKTW